LIIKLDLYATILMGNINVLNVDLDKTKECCDRLKRLNMKKALTSYPDQGLSFLPLLMDENVNGGQAWIRLPFAPSALRVRHSARLLDAPCSVASSGPQVRIHFPNTFNKKAPKKRGLFY
jgi:hypothetical protein